MLKKIVDKIKGKSFHGSVFTNFGQTKLNWDTSRYLNTYADSVYVYACISKRAQKVGQIEFQLFRGDKEISTDPILELLYKPNKMQSKNEFFELYQIYKDLAGSAFIYVMREGTKIQELHNLRPDRVTELRSEVDGSILGYKYKVGPKEFKFKPEEIIASHYPSPLQQIGGHSPIQSARTVIDTEVQLETYQNRVLKNGGRVEGIITHKVENLTQDQIDAMKREFEDKYSGAENSGKPLVLYGGIEYKNIGLTPTELSYIDSKKFMRGDILSVFGVPLPIIDQSDVGALGSNGYDAALRIFLSETVKPLHDNLVQKLNEFLVPKELELRSVDPSPDDVEKKLKIVESGIKNYYMTQNEARELMGFGEMSNGNSILLPFNLTTQSTPTNSVKRKSYDHPFRDKEKRAMYWYAVQKSLENDRQKFAQALKGYFGEQLDRIVPLMEAGKKDFVWNWFDIVEENKLGFSILYPVLEQVFIDAGRDIFDIMGGEGVFRIRERPRFVLESRARFFINEINTTTFGQLQEAFESAVLDGKTRDVLVNEVRDIYQNSITTKRAETIVRTETHVAQEEAKLDAYQQLNIPTKIWVHNPQMSQNPRETHALIDGMEVPVTSPFIVEGEEMMYPGDGSAENSINCNCSI